MRSTLPVAGLEGRERYTGIWYKFACDTQVLILTIRPSNCKYPAQCIRQITRVPVHTTGDYSAICWPPLLIIFYRFFVPPFDHSISNRGSVHPLRHFKPGLRTRFTIYAQIRSMKLVPIGILAPIPLPPTNTGTVSCDDCCQRCQCIPSLFPPLQPCWIRQALLQSI